MRSVISIVRRTVLILTCGDAAAAARLGMEHLLSKVGQGPIHMIGYSTGSALAVDYALGALDRTTAPVPASLILVSRKNCSVCRTIIAPQYRHVMVW